MPFVYMLSMAMLAPPGRTELSIYNRDGMAHKAENIYYLAL